MSHGRHVKRMNRVKLALILTGLAVGALVILFLIVGLLNPAPGSPEKHAQPSVSAHTPTHRKLPPKPPATPPGCTCTSVPKPPPDGRAMPPQTRYTVMLGDSLSSIADMYRLPSYVPLYDANRTVIGNNPNIIHVGLQLRVPIPGRGT